MVRLALAAVLGLTACGQLDDDRPATLEYVTAAVLVPYCGNAQCHSSLTRADNYVLDTVEDARETINRFGLVTPNEPESSLLYLVLISPGGDNALPRMPYDQPMPDADVALIRRWIEQGAPGL